VGKRTKTTKKSPATSPR